MDKQDKEIHKLKLQIALLTKSLETILEVQSDCVCAELARLGLKFCDEEDKSEFWNDSD